MGEKEKLRKRKEIKSIITISFIQNAKHDDAVINDSKNDVDAIFSSTLILNTRI